MIDGVTSVVIGPDEHGVTRHAIALAETTGARLVRHVDVAGAGLALAAATRGARVCHWHFTDRLFADDVGDAARRFLALATPLAVRHVVSLHDVPAGGRSSRQARRVAAYRVVADVADAVIVASDHEHERLRRIGIEDDVVVIPLPVGPPPLLVRAASAPSTTPTVAVVGFVYPGKGHAEVLAATTGLPEDVAVVALGRASPGHDELVDRLVRTARTVGRRFCVTGFLTDADLTHAVSAVTVPVVAARAVSASASIGTWLAAGRRPIAVRNGFVDELDRRAPGLLTPCLADDLGPAIRRALASPTSTWLDRPVPVELGEEAVADAHRALYARVAA